MTNLAWFAQYVIGGFCALFVSAYIFTKGSSENKTSALKGFLAFGVLITIWEFASFFQRTAPNQMVSAVFFYVILISSSLSQPAYLLTALSIQKEKIYRFLIFIPAIVRIITFGFLDITYQLTEYGWTYTMPFSGIPLELGTTIYFGYFIGTIIILFGLARKARSKILKNKYYVLLAGFTLFQVIGFTVTNYYLTIDPNFPPMGGILQFLTFITIGFAVSMKETRLPTYSYNLNSFHEVYSSFLTDFYNLSTGTNLGEKSFKFTEFLDKSLLEDKVSIKTDEISFNAPDDLESLQLINRNLKFLEEEGNNKLTDSYLRVLKAGHGKFGDKFDTVVNENIDFLKKSDLIYGISGGHYLKSTHKDESLDVLYDVEACLKIYKRLLLLVSDKLPLSDFQKKLAIYQTTKTVESNKYGEISIEKTKDTINLLPLDQRLPSIIESFNPLVSWVYSTILSNSFNDNDTTLESLKHVLRLNHERAIQLRIYPTLLERLAAKVPKEEIEQLYHEYLEEVIELKSGELQQVRNRLLDAERLSAIGRTTAMVGHDLRNPLQAIVNTIYLGRMKLNLIPPQIKKEEIEEIYNKIESQVRYMDKIVTDLQDFSRKVAVKKIKTDLKELIYETLSAISAPENIKTIVKSNKETPFASVDPASLKRVIQNLILNAIQAMPDGGEIQIGIHSSDDEITITIEDAGVGIPKESIERIFEPFFTTKAQGQGLGLSICKKFVEANGGSIKVESDEGKGTEFTIIFPQT